MAKKASILDELLATPSQRKHNDWYSRLPEESQQQIAEVFRAFHRGELDHHSRLWIAEQLIKKFGLTIAAKSVTDTMREARWRS